MEVPNRVQGYTVLLKQEPCIFKTPAFVAFFNTMFEVIDIQVHPSLQTQRYLRNENVLHTRAR